MSGPQAKGSLWGYILLSLAWLGVLGGTLLFVQQPSAQPIEILPPPTAAPSAAPAASATPGPIHVDVAGAVRTPGVYTLPIGSLVVDAITAAGGAGSEADLDRLNKAVTLQDGMQVYVPHKDEPLPEAATPSSPAASGAAASGTASAEADPVNINTASLEALDSLPGIGPSLAQAIVAGRPYSTVEDLLRVQGIGEARLKQLRARITVQ